MTSRRDFVKMSAISAAALGCGVQKVDVDRLSQVKKPIVIATWDHGLRACKEAWKTLRNNGKALDSVEQGVRFIEADPSERSVGIGGIPDREGNVTLDACIMDYNSDCGSVAFLKEIMNPISVARKVMEETPHVMLVGEGAQQFALQNGFEKENLLTEKSKKEWENWLKESKYQPVINVENHDTIGMLALDEDRNLAGACTTSGVAYKLHGRVGDSPIIGAGLFLDNEVGAACATGLGEAVIRVAGSAMVVELMRNGKAPDDACREVVERIISKHKNLDNLQVGFLALNNMGEYGGYSIRQGFNYAVCDVSDSWMVEAEYKMTWE